MTEEANRLTDKTDKPSEQRIQEFIGPVGVQQLEKFEVSLDQHYDLKRELRYPFGKQDGWGYRYAHKKSLLCYVFFEEGGIACTLSINDKGAPKVEAMLDQLQPHIQELWQNRYPCGKHGGWLHPRIKTDEDLRDILALITIKITPKKS